MASSNKRERDLARARYEGQQRRRAEAHAKARRRQQVIGGAVALVVVLAGAWWFISPRSEPAAQTPDTPAASPTPTPSPSVSTAGCTTPVDPTEKTQSWDSLQGADLKAGKTYTITLETNCGDVVIQADPKLVKAAPKTVASQVFLTRKGFFDASDCFRLTTEGLFVLQCGSPTNDAAGSPGYKLPDENLPKAGTGNYPAGTVAMANSGADTGGSQFFLVYDDTTLDPNYTIWGKITKGLDVLQKVAAQGVDDGSTDGAPAQPLVITKATVSSS